MLFDLEVLSDEKPLVIRYDNLANRFYDSKTGRNLLADSAVRDYKRFSETYDIKPDEIGLLYINLGMNCNFSCKYCHQNYIRKTVEVVSSSPVKALNLIKILKKADLKLHGISFWGGEPLVYWKTMKVLIPALREMYPKAMINFPTNGSLINDEILDFLSRYHVGFYISYDGRETNRDFSIFDDKKIVDSLRRYLASSKPGKDHGISIMPTQNKCSVPVSSIKEEFRQLGIKLDSIALYSIARCNPYNRQHAQDILIPRDKAERHSHFVYQVLHHQVADTRLYDGLFSRFDHTAKLFYMGIGADSVETAYCANSQGRDICVDMNGNVFNCMNIPVHNFGPLLDFKPFPAATIFKQAKDKEACAACPYIICCRGGCPLIHDDRSEEFIVNCSNMKIMAIPFFRTVVECILGVYLKKITRCDTGEVIATF